MIVGVGVDLEEIDRIKRVYQYWQQRFVSRILSEPEQALFCQRLARSEVKGLSFLATRFAAKEAFVKALRHKKITAPLGWQYMAILSDTTSGAPDICFFSPLDEWLNDQGYRVHLSLSDSTHYVTATVIIETK
jgi:holo-[acyl-carrier protein] synthase